MQFSDYANAIRRLGREVNPDTLLATRELVTPLVAAQADAETPVSVVRDVHYGDDERQRLDIFTPASGQEPQRPVLVFVHGGGFVAGDKHMPGTPFYDNIAIWAVQHGCNAVNITYRLAPQHQWPSGVEDIHLAISYIRTHGDASGISGERVFLMGQSAGAAHAASYVAHPEFYEPHGHGLRGLILLSGLYDFTRKTGPLEQAYLGTDPSRYAQRSSVEGLLASDLPMLLTLAENDPPFFEQQTLDLLSALQRKRQQMPRFVHLTGQNHLSAALYLGLPDDLLGPQLQRFIQDCG